MGNYKDDRNSPHTITILLPVFLIFCFLFFACGGKSKFDSTPSVNVIAGDAVGRVYVPERNIIAIYENNEWKSITLPEYCAGIRTVYVNESGVIWAGTSSGICRIKGGNAEFIVEPLESLECKLTHNIIEDTESNIWIAVGCVSLDPIREWGGFILFKENMFSVFKIEDNIIGLSSHRDKGVYSFSISSHSGIYKFNGTKWVPVVLPVYHDVLSMTFDNNGNLWLGGVSNLSKCITDIYCETYPQELSPNINAIDVDFQNNIWLGTGKGVVKFDGANFVFYTNESTKGGLWSDNVLAVKYIANTLWAGTSSGLSSFDGEHWTHWKWDGDIWYSE